MHHKRKTLRLRNHDYAQDDYYFVTNCVQDKVCCFGEITNGKMHLNAYGTIAHNQWQWLETQYPYVVLYEYVVMPDHMHGIIGINRKQLVTGTQVKIKSLTELMGAYKTTSSKQIRLAGYSGFKWQRSFYEHIIRDDRAYVNIAKYIENNPRNWKKNDFLAQLKSTPE